MLAAEKAETSREIPSRLFLVVFPDLLALLLFPVVLLDDTLVMLGPWTSALRKQCRKMIWQRRIRE